jgi:hypothetical protein
LPDGIPHPQGGLPGRGDLIVPGRKLDAVAGLESRQSVEGGYELGVEAGHDDGDAEEHCPEDCEGVLPDGGPEGEVVFCGCDFAGRADLKQCSLFDIRGLLFLKSWQVGGLRDAHDVDGCLSAEYR